MKSLLLLSALLIVVVPSRAQTVIGDAVTYETTCAVVRKTKADEKRVVFVLRCPGSEDIGVLDTDEDLYKKGGVMMMQFDKEPEKENKQ